MRMRYHAWMNRAINRESFTLREHLVYLAMVIGMACVFLGAFAFCFAFPSIESLLVVAGAVLLMYWVMAGNRKYLETTPHISDTEK